MAAAPVPFFLMDEDGEPDDAGALRDTLFRLLEGAPPSEVYEGKGEQEDGRGSPAGGAAAAAAAPPPSRIAALTGAPARSGSRSRQKEERRGPRKPSHSPRVPRASSGAAAAAAAAAAPRRSWSSSLFGGADTATGEASESEEDEKEGEEGEVLDVQAVPGEREVELRPEDVRTLQEAFQLRTWPLRLAHLRAYARRFPQKHLGWLLETRETGGSYLTEAELSFDEMARNAKKYGSLRRPELVDTLKKSADKDNTKRLDDMRFAGSQHVDEKEAAQNDAQGHVLASMHVNVFLEALIRNPSRRTEQRADVLREMLLILRTNLKEYDPFLGKYKLTIDDVDIDIDVAVTDDRQRLANAAHRRTLEDLLEDSRISDRGPSIGFNVVYEMTYACARLVCLLRYLLFERDVPKNPFVESTEAVFWCKRCSEVLALQAELGQLSEAYRRQMENGVNGKDKKSSLTREYVEAYNAVCETIVELCPKGVDPNRPRPKGLVSVFRRTQDAPSSEVLRSGVNIMNDALAGSVLTYRDMYHNILDTDNEGFPLASEALCIEEILPWTQTGDNQDRRFNRLKRVLRQYVVDLRDALDLSFVQRSLVQHERVPWLWQVITANTPNIISMVIVINWMLKQTMAMREQYNTAADASLHAGLAVAVAEQVVRHGAELTANITQALWYAPSTGSSVTRFGFTAAEAPRVVSQLLPGVQPESNEALVQVFALPAEKDGNIFPARFRVLETTQRAVANGPPVLSVQVVGAAADLKTARANPIMLDADGRITPETVHRVTEARSLNIVVTQGDDARALAIQRARQEQAWSKYYAVTDELMRSIEKDANDGNTQAFLDTEKLLERMKPLNDLAEELAAYGRQRQNATNWPRLNATERMTLLESDARLKLAYTAEMFETLHSVEDQQWFVRWALMFQGVERNPNGDGFVFGPSIGQDFSMWAYVTIVRSTLRFAGVECQADGVSWLGALACMLDPYNVRLMTPLVITGCIMAAKFGLWRPGMAKAIRMALLRVGFDLLQAAFSGPQGMVIGMSAMFLWQGRAVFNPLGFVASMAQSAHRAGAPFVSRFSDTIREWVSAPEWAAPYQQQLTTQVGNLLARNDLLNSRRLNFLSRTWLHMIAAQPLHRDEQLVDIFRKVLEDKTVTPQQTLQRLADISRYPDNFEAIARMHIPGVELDGVGLTASAIYPHIINAFYQPIVSGFFGGIAAAVRAGARFVCPNEVLRLGQSGLVTDLADTATRPSILALNVMGWLAKRCGLRERDVLGNAIQMRRQLAALQMNCRVMREGVITGVTREVSTAISSAQGDSQTVQQDDLDNQERLVLRRMANQQDSEGQRREREKLRQEERLRQRTRGLLSNYYKKAEPGARPT